MDTTQGISEGAGGAIWLRYATQFTIGGRTHTIEMGIPVPVGADEKTREQLLREADAGMEQLASHVEKRVVQMLQENRTAQPTPSSSSSSAPQPPVAVKAVDKPIPPSAPPATSLGAPTQGRETRPEGAAPSRQKSPASEVRPASHLPGAARTEEDPTNTLSLPQFIQHIKEKLNLNPKQAMTLLNVKTLSGVNLREAIEHLQMLVAQESTPTPDASQEVRSDTSLSPIVSPSRPSSNGTVPTSSALSTVSTPQLVSSALAAPMSENGRESSVHEELPVYIFDEEVDPEEGDSEEEEALTDLEELDDVRGLTVHERTRAEAVLSRLRESRGATLASASRLQVLHNVTNSQVSSEQLLSLVKGIWSVTSLRKLKVDQLEALISWAKEDDFVSEVEAILLLIEEERYARGNR